MVKETKIRAVRHYRKYFFSPCEQLFVLFIDWVLSPLAYIQAGFGRGGARKGAPTEGCTKMAATCTHLTMLRLFHIFSLYSLAMKTGCFFSSLFTSTELEFQEKHIQPLQGLWSKRWELALLSAWPLPDHSVLLFPPKDGAGASSNSRVSFCNASGSGKLPVPPASLLGVSAKMEAARKGEINGSRFCNGDVKRSTSEGGSEERREKKVKRLRKGKGKREKPGTATPLGAAATFFWRPEAVHLWSCFKLSTLELWGCSHNRDAW